VSTSGVDGLFFVLNISGRLRLGLGCIDLTHRLFASGLWGSLFFLQQPSGDMPDIAAVPVALAGAIMPGVARFIVALSAHADVFGVGMTAIVGLMLVPPSCVMSG
jgi:hypothetical protein